jgi:hypothetical protein
MASNGGRCALAGPYAGSDARDLSAHVATYLDGGGAKSQD